MIVSVVFAALAIFLWKPSTPMRLGFLGMAQTLAAQWLCGENVYDDDFETPAISFGLDWLVLALLANTSFFVFIERVWPHDPDQKTLRAAWRLDLV